MQDAAQRGLLLPDLAQAVAAAVHAKQIPVQDLLGIQQFIETAKPLSIAKGRRDVTQTFARLVFQAFIDADGTHHEPPVSEAVTSRPGVRHPGTAATLRPKPA